MSAPENLILGSGKLYVKALTAQDTFETARLNTYCTTQNHIGWIKGGATISYTPSTYDVKDDMGAIYEHFITGETVKFSAGVLTWNKDTIVTLINNESITHHEQSGTTPAYDEILIGADGFTTMDKYIVVFEAKPDTKNVTRYFGIIGTSDAGLNLSYKPESETTLSLNFTATAFGANHRLLKIEEVQPVTQ